MPSDDDNCEYLLNARRFFRNRFQRYAVDRSANTGTDLDGSPLTLMEICDILAEDKEEVPPYTICLLPRRFAKDLVAKLSTRVTYGHLAKIIQNQLKYHSAQRLP